MVHPEFRQDPVTGIWVIISEGRRNRPDQLTQSNGKRIVPAYTPDCFFCLGNSINIIAPERAAEFLKS